MTSEVKIENKVSDLPDNEIMRLRQLNPSKEKRERTESDSSENEFQVCKEEFFDDKGPSKRTKFRRLKKSTLSAWRQSTVDELDVKDSGNNDATVNKIYWKKILFGTYIPYSHFSEYPGSTT